ncbi:MAG: hypothetical protein IPK78_16845 [Rhodospirillales bacterium]|nr:hypothetical protein [Rhodospirillales bacterium]
MVETHVKKAGAHLRRLSGRLANAAEAAEGSSSTPAAPATAPQHERQQQRQQAEQPAGPATEEQQASGNADNDDCRRLDREQQRLRIGRGRPSDDSEAKEQQADTGEQPEEHRVSAPLAAA